MKIGLRGRGTNSTAHMNPSPTLAGSRESPLQMTARATERSIGICWKVASALLWFLILTGSPLQVDAACEGTPSKRKLQTPLGFVQVVRRDVFDVIKVDGKVVFDSAPEPYIRLYGSFPSGRGFVVLFGVNAGGSHTPVDQLYFLLLNSDRRTQIVTDEDFKSPSCMIASRFQNGNVVIDLGFDAKRRKTARLRGGKINISYEPPPNALPMVASDCIWIYENSSDECIDAGRRFRMPCEESARQYRGFSGRVTTGMAPLLNHPGFNSAALEKACFEQCTTGQRLPFDDFKRLACGIP